MQLKISLDSNNYIKYFKNNHSNSVDCDFFLAINNIFLNSYRRRVVMTTQNNSKNIIIILSYFLNLLHFFLRKLKK